MTNSMRFMSHSVPRDWFPEIKELLEKHLAGVSVIYRVDTNNCSAGLGVMYLTFSDEHARHRDWFQARLAGQENQVMDRVGDSIRQLIADKLGFIVGLTYYSIPDDVDLSGV